MKKKKMNTYVRFVVIILCCMLAGFVGGFVNGYFSETGEWTGISGAAQNVIDWFRRWNLPVLLVLAAVCVIFDEWVIRRMKKQYQEMRETQDEEKYDWQEYQLNRIGNLAGTVNQIFQIVGILVLSFGYSGVYIDSLTGNKKLLLLDMSSMVLFILLFLYLGIWQIRQVKLLQRIYPEKKGDPTSRKFQEQWLESCDEAERDVVYKASMKSHLFMLKAFPALMVAALLCNLFWETGLAAIFFLAAAWLMENIIYGRACLGKKREKYKG